MEFYITTCHMSRLSWHPYFPWELVQMLYRQIHSSFTVKLYNACIKIYASNTTANYSNYS